jgi:hypothetical protein
MTVIYLAAPHNKNICSQLEAVTGLDDHISVDDHVQCWMLRYDGKGLLSTLVYEFKQEYKTRV